MTTKNGHDQGGTSTQDTATSPTERTPSGRKFALGRTYVTSQAHATLHPVDVVLALGRHHRGDWGEVCDEDWQENEVGLRDGYRLLSVYRDRQGTKFWIITEWDRSVTTVLLPNDCASCHDAD